MSIESIAQRAVNQMVEQLVEYLESDQMDQVLVEFHRIRNEWIQEYKQAYTDQEMMDILRELDEYDVPQLLLALRNADNRNM